MLFFLPLVGGKTREMRKKEKKGIRGGAEALAARSHVDPRRLQKTDQISWASLQLSMALAPIDRIDLSLSLCSRGFAFVPRNLNL